MALLVFLPPFYYSSPFGFAAFFQSVVVLARVACAVWFSPVCFAAGAKVGREAAALCGKGQVQRNLQTSHGGSPKDENKVVELG